MKKRLLSLFLAAIMICSMIPVVTAVNNEAVEAADALYELGLFNGTGTDENGAPIYSLEKEMTRHEAVTMLVNLLGKADEAVEGSWETPFTDVAAWAKPYVGYAYANGLTSGTSATTYGGKELITASQYLTFVLRALGYTVNQDFRWDAAWELSDVIGLTDGRYNENTKTFLRGDAAIISNKAVYTTLKNSNQMLYETIGLQNVSPKEPVQQKSTLEMLQGIWVHDTKELIIEGNSFTEIMVASTGENVQYKKGTFELDGQKYIETYDGYILDLRNGKMKAYSAGDTVKEEIEILTDDTLGFAAYWPFWGYTKVDTHENHDRYQSMFESVDLEELADELGSTTNTDYVKPSVSVNSADYAYLAGTDFRSIRRQYPSSVAQCAYVYAYRDTNGDLCVLTYVRYKILTNWDKLTLHNMTKGTQITDPAEYYDNLADRSYGATKLYYMDLYGEVLQNQMKMMQAMSSILKGGSNTFGGVYVDAYELNL